VIDDGPRGGIKGLACRTADLLEVIGGIATWSGGRCASLHRHAVGELLELSREVVETGDDVVEDEARARGEEERAGCVVLVEEWLGAPERAELRLEGRVPGEVERMWWTRVRGSVQPARSGGWRLEGSER
jgi:hypothetical protein